MALQSIHPIGYKREKEKCLKGWQISGWGLPEGVSKEKKRKQKEKRKRVEFSLKRKICLGLELGEVSSKGWGFFFLLAHEENGLGGRNSSKAVEILSLLPISRLRGGRRRTTVVTSWHGLYQYKWFHMMTSSFQTHLAWFYYHFVFYIKTYEWWCGLDIMSEHVSCFFLLLLW